MARHTVSRKELVRSSNDSSLKSLSWIPSHQDQAMSQGQMHCHEPRGIKIKQWLELKCIIMNCIAPYSVVHHQVPSVLNHWHWFHRACQVFSTIGCCIKPAKDYFGCTRICPDHLNKWFEKIVLQINNIRIYAWDHIYMRVHKPARESIDVPDQKCSHAPQNMKKLGTYVSIHLSQHELRVSGKVIHGLYLLCRLV